MGTFAKRWPATATRVSLVVMVCLTMIFGTIITLAGHKWGRWSPLAVATHAGVSIGKTRLFVDPGVTAFSGPFLKLLDPRLKSTELDIGEYLMQSAHTLDDSVILVSGPPKDYPVFIPPIHVYEETHYKPVLFGYAIGQWPETPQQTQIFTNGLWQVEKVGPLLKFGFVADLRPSIWTLFDCTTLRRVLLEERVSLIE